MDVCHVCSFSNLCLRSLLAAASSGCSVSKRSATNARVHLKKAALGDDWSVIQEAQRHYGESQLLDGSCAQHRRKGGQNQKEQDNNSIK